MLKIVYPICCGIDVHETFLVATAAKTNLKNLTTYDSKRFSTFTNGLKELAQWLMDHHCTDVCMESTGKYWIPVYNILEQLNHLIDTLQVSADSLAAPFSSALTIIESVPGIAHLSALVILSEVGHDMTQFPSAKHLCSWAGLAPCNDQSAGKKKSTRISRAGVYIKPVLVQCAYAALKDSSFPYYRERYNALKHRRGKKKAIIAIARILLSVIYTLLSGGELFDKEMYEESLGKPSYILSPEQQLLLFADKLGYEIVKVQEPLPV